MMISYQEALTIIQQHTSLASVERCAINAALNRISAAAVYSRESLPAFDNSAMDGFAVGADNAKNGEKLLIAGSTFAGQAPAQPENVKGTAWRIMTGAPLPSAYDAVIPIEKVTVQNDHIVLQGSVIVGQHIRCRGEDFAEGQLVLSAGQKIQAFDVMALAATGHAEIAVFAAANAVVFATGDELVDDPSVPLAAGQIRNSNAPFLLAALQQHGVSARYGGLQRDNAEAFRQQLSATLTQQPDLILSSGAVSAGDADFIPQVIRELGGQILFHKVAIKPGKPILLAKFSNGSFYFGLPGNPISTAIGFRFFVQAFLAARCGLPFGQTLTAKLKTPIFKKNNLREFRKAHLHIESGELWVAESRGQESHRIAPLQSSNAWLIVEENSETVAAGQHITIAGWQHDGLF